MTTDGQPTGGVQVNGGFGGLSARPRAIAARPRFELVVAGDFGGPRQQTLIDATGEDIASLLAGFGARARFDVPNRLGTEPPALAIDLKLAALRDLDPKTLAGRVPQLVRAQEIAGQFARSRALDGAAQGPAFSLLTAELLRQLPPARTPAAPALAAAAPADDGALDRLLGMVEVPAAPGPGDSAESALSAFIGANARREPAPAGTGDSPALIARQAQDIADHPAWRRIEAVWRGLRLILSARGREAKPGIRLWDVAGDALAASLAGEAFAQALQEDGEAPRWGAILVLGAHDATAKDLATLKRLAAAGEALRLPVIVSLAPGFFCRPPAEVAAMDNPAALLDGPAHAAWRGLRAAPESRWLFACWNDLVLRAGAGDEPLHGEAGLVAAAQIVASLGRTGWPTEILGGESPLEGLELAEVPARAGRSAAIPLRALLDPGIARDLAGDGLVCPVCRADRDQAWLVRAASVHDHGKVWEEERAAMEGFAGLSFRFVSGLLEAVCQDALAGLPRRASGAEAAAMIAQALRDALDGSGPGAAVAVTPQGADGEATRAFEVSVTLGRDVMGGFGFGFDIEG